MSAHTILSRILFVLYVIAVLFVCFLRPDRMPDIQKTILGIPTDKVAHFIMFLPFPILASLSFCKPQNKVWNVLFSSVLLLLAGTCLAALTEYLQGFLPYRSKDFSDFEADFIAVLISSLVVFVVSITHLKKKN